jgi:hypothetical protein
MCTFRKKTISIDGHSKTHSLNSAKNWVIEIITNDVIFIALRTAVKITENVARFIFHLTYGLSKTESAELLL